MIWILIQDNLDLDLDYLNFEIGDDVIVVASPKTIENWKYSIKYSINFFREWCIWNYNFLYKILILKIVIFFFFLKFLDWFGVILILDLVLYWNFYVKFWFEFWFDQDNLDLDLDYLNFEIGDDVIVVASPKTIENWKYSIKYSINFFREWCIWNYNFLYKILILKIISVDVIFFFLNF